MFASAISYSVCYGKQVSYVHTALLNTVLSLLILVFTVLCLRSSVPYASCEGLRSLCIFLHHV